MRILQINKFYYPWGGATTYLFTLSDLLAADGHTVIPFAMHHPKNNATPYEKYFVSEIDLGVHTQLSWRQKITAGLRMLWSFEAARQLDRLLTDHPVDVAHLHNIYYHLSPSILWVLKKHKVPVVFTAHDYYLVSPNYTLSHDGAAHLEDANGWYWSVLRHKSIRGSFWQSLWAVCVAIVHHKIFRIYQRNIDRVIAPSAYIAEMLVRHGWPKEKIMMIEHPVALHLPDESTQDGTGVLYVGRFTKEKGVNVFIAAAKQNPEIPHTLIGDGVLTNEFARIGLPANIRIIPWGDKDEVVRQMSRARLVVAPSIWPEVFGLTVAEAKKLGKVVIGSNMAGIATQLPPELLVEPNNAPALAKMIKKWYTTPFTERTELGNKLRQDALARHDPKQHLERMLEVYRSLLSR